MFKSESLCDQRVKFFAGQVTILATTCGPPPKIYITNLQLLKRVKTVKKGKNG